MKEIGVEDLQRLLAIEGSLTKRPKWADENAHRATRFHFQIADRNIARLKAEGAWPVPLAGQHKGQSWVFDDVDRDGLRLLQGHIGMVALTLFDAGDRAGAGDLARLVRYATEPLGELA